MTEFRLGLLMVITLIGMFGFLFATKYSNFNTSSNGKIEQHSTFINSGMVNTLMAGEQKPVNEKSGSTSSVTSKSANSSAEPVWPDTNVSATKDETATWTNHDQTAQVANVTVKSSNKNTGQTEIQSFDAVPLKDENPLDLWGKPVETSSKSNSAPATQNPWDAPTEAVSSTSATQATNNHAVPVNPFVDQPVAMQLAESAPTAKNQPVMSFSDNSKPSSSPFAMENNQLAANTPQAPVEQQGNDPWGPPVGIPQEKANSATVESKLSPEPLSFDTVPAAMPDSFGSNALPEPQMKFTTPMDINSNNKPAAVTTSATGAPLKLKLLAVHEVHEGDNFWSIAKKYYEAGKYGVALEEYNKERIPDPKKIRPGMKVLVPQLAELEQKMPHLAPVLKKEEAPLPAGFFHDGNGHPMYRIGDSDTLSKIAQEHLGRSTRWQEIQQLNPELLKDLNKIKPGLVIKLPQDASNARIASENDDFFR